MVYGDRVVGIQGAVPEGSGLPRRQGDAILDRLQHTSIQLRVWTELQGSDGSSRYVSIVSLSTTRPTLVS